jgi:hypothetical protein
VALLRNSEFICVIEVDQFTDAVQLKDHTTLTFIRVQTDTSSQTSLDFLLSKRYRHRQNT